MGSYHYPTITNIALNVNKYQVNPPVDRFLYNKTDWNKFRELSGTVFEGMNLDSENPLTPYEDFCSRLDTLKSMVVPKLVKDRSFRTRPPAPWWNKLCEDRVIASYNALKIYRDNPTIENYINYKKLDALKKRTISEQKWIGWNIVKFGTF